MFSAPGPWEIILIIVIILLIFGPKRLPDLARSLGEGIREFKKSLNSIDEKPPVPEERVKTSGESGSPAEKG